MEIHEIPYVTAVIHTDTKGSKGKHKSFSEELKEQLANKTVTQGVTGERSEQEDGLIWNFG